MLNNLMNWHRDLVYKWMDILRIDAYEVGMIGFCKGFLLVLILQWIF